MKALKVLAVSLTVSFLGSFASAEDLVVDHDMTLDQKFNYTNVRFLGDYTLTIGENVTGYLSREPINDGHKVVIRLEQGAQMQLGWLISTNAATTRIEFNGGWLVDGGAWGSPWFKVYEGSSVELASVNGNPISFTHPNSQWKYLREGGGRLFTSGEGKLDIATAGIHNGTILYCKLNVPMENFLHTGGTVFRGNTPGTGGWIGFSSNDTLPQGLVELGGDNLGFAYLDIGSSMQVVDQLKAYGRSCITNVSGRTSTITLEKDGSFIDSPICGPEIGITKGGAGTTSTLRTDRVSATLRISAGTLIVQKLASADNLQVGGLQVAKGAALVIDGVDVLANAYYNDGGVVTFKNGGTLSVVNTVDASATVFNSEGLKYDGAMAFVKRGEGTLHYSGDEMFALPLLKVAKGTFQFVGPSGTLNRWWRFTVKQCAWAGCQLSIGPVRLLDKDCGFADGAGMGNAGGGFSLVTVSDPKDLQVRQVTCSSSDYTMVKVGSDNPQDPRAIFNSSSVYDCTFNNPKPSYANPATWISWTYRIPNGDVRILGYNLKTQWGNISCWPRTWSIESSPDGVTWQLMDERINYSSIINGQQWYNAGGYGIGGNDGHPATMITFDSIDVSKLPTAAGFAAGSGVQVDGGATLDCSLCATQPELASLTVDAAAGGGTLKNVKLASSGKLYLVNYTGKSSYVLPHTFVDSVTVGSLEDWEVYVNGEFKNGYRLVWDGGKLVLPGVGMRILLR